MFPPGAFSSDLPESFHRCLEAVVGIACGARASGPSWVFLEFGLVEFTILIITRVVPVTRALRNQVKISWICTWVRNRWYRLEIVVVDFIGLLCSNLLPPGRERSLQMVEHTYDKAHKNTA